MVEIVEFDFDAFSRDAQIVEKMMIFRNEKEMRMKMGILEENDRKLLARLIVSAAYRKDEARIDKYLTLIYSRLLGEDYYEKGLWIDKPLNSLGDDLISNIYGYHRGLWSDDEPWSYDELVSHALYKIEESWEYRHPGKKR